MEMKIKIKVAMVKQIKMKFNEGTEESQGSKQQNKNKIKKENISKSGWHETQARKNYCFFFKNTKFESLKKETKQWTRINI